MCCLLSLLVYIVAYHDLYVRARTDTMILVGTVQRAHLIKLLNRLGYSTSQAPDTITVRHTSLVCLSVVFQCLWCYGLLVVACVVVVDLFMFIGVTYMSDLCVSRCTQQGVERSLRCLIRPPPCLIFGHRAVRTHIKRFVYRSRSGSSAAAAIMDTSAEQQHQQQQQAADAADSPPTTAAVSSAPVTDELQTKTPPPTATTAADEAAHDSVLDRPIDMLTETVVDRAPIAMSMHTPVPRLHMMFVMLGLKHVFITDAGRIVGVVWRSDMVEGKINQ